MIDLDELVKKINDHVEDGNISFTMTSMELLHILNRAIAAEAKLAEIEKQEPVGEFNGVFGFSGRSYFEVTCFDALPMAGAKLYASPVKQFKQSCAECGAGADDEGLCLYCVKCMFSAQQSPAVAVLSVNDLLDRYEKYIQSIPVGSENATRGQSAYNWHRAAMQVLRELSTPTQSAEQKAILADRFKGRKLPSNPIIEIMEPNDISDHIAQDRKLVDQPDSHGLNPLHVGSDFEDFLKDDGIYEEVHAEAVERVQKWVGEQSDSAALSDDSVNSIACTLHNYATHLHYAGNEKLADQLEEIVLRLWKIKPSPDHKPQRVTEQDAREIIEHFSTWWARPNEKVPGMIEDHDKQVTTVYLDDEGLTLLAKLNEHREPDYKTMFNKFLDEVEHYEYESEFDTALKNARQAIAQCKGEIK